MPPGELEGGYFVRINFPFDVTRRRYGSPLWTTTISRAFLNRDAESMRSGAISLGVAPAGGDSVSLSVMGTDELAAGNVWQRPLPLNDVPLNDVPADTTEPRIARASRARWMPRILSVSNVAMGAGTQWTTRSHGRYLL